MLSKKEKEERKRKRLTEDKKRADKFPGAFYVSGDLQIIFPAGHRREIIIRTNNLAQFEPCKIGADTGWVEAYAQLINISQVSKLAVALTARLNDMIAEANKDIVKLQVPLVAQVQRSRASESTITIRPDVQHQTNIEREQWPYDEAVLDILRVVSRIHPGERIGVLDLARARVALQNAMSDRIDSEVREELNVGIVSLEDLA